MHEEAILSDPINKTFQVAKGASESGGLAQLGLKTNKTNLGVLATPLCSSKAASALQYMGQK